MPVYEYKGVSSLGKKLSGVQDGESLKAVRARLKKDGVVVLEIQEATRARAVRSGSWNFTTAGRVRLGDVANATRQLATLLSSGLPLMDSLSLLVEQEESEALKSALSSVRDAVREGSSLADALKANPKAFSDLYVNMVSAGETSGTLEITLDRLSDFLDEQVRFRGKLAAALAYPALMSLIGIGVLFFLFTFVMPRVTGMFQDMNRQLPFITLLLLWIVNFLSSYWWALVLALAGSGLLSQASFQDACRQGVARRLAAAHAGLRRAHQDDRGFAIYAHPGDAAGERGAGAGSARYREERGREHGAGQRRAPGARERARRRTHRGPAAAERTFPAGGDPDGGGGEKSGELEKMLLKISDSFDRTVETRITALMSLLEPVIILVMGLIVGFIVIAIMLPILEMSSGVS